MARMITTSRLLDVLDDAQLLRLVQFEVNL